MLTILSSSSALPTTQLSATSSSSPSCHCPRLPKSWRSRTKIPRRESPNIGWPTSSSSSYTGKKKPMPCHCSIDTSSAPGLPPRSRRQCHAYLMVAERTRNLPTRNSKTQRLETSSLPRQTSPTCPMPGLSFQGPWSTIKHSTKSSGRLVS